MCHVSRTIKPFNNKAGFHYDSPVCYARTLLRLPAGYKKQGASFFRNLKMKPIKYFLSIQMVYMLW